MRTLATLILLCSFLFHFGAVYGQNRTEYEIQISLDGSAVWIARQTGASAQITIDTMAEFEQRIFLVANAAAIETNRTMAAQPLSINITPSGPYIVVEYMFLWVNFSVLESARITVEDMFQAEDLFSKLYGDGEVKIKYPSKYVPVAVSPQPYESDKLSQTLVWLGTMSLKDFSLVLEQESEPFDVARFLASNAYIIVSLAVVSIVLLACLYMIVRRKRRKGETEEMVEPSFVGDLASDEAKILRLLKSSGNTLHQSAIVDALKFSKAKTSLLLSSLENQGVISRVKKGRDKIVTLVKQEKD